MNTSDTRSPAVAGQVVFAQELHALTEKYRDRPMCIGALLDATEGRGFHFMLLLLAMPFVTPLPMPGVSTPFGFVIALIGARFAIGRKIWMPRHLLEWQVPPHIVARLINGADRTAERLRFLLRPRLTYVVDNLACRRLAGLLIMVCGSLMVLPIPLPLTDGLPAMTVSLLAAGALARDGVFFLAGCGVFGFTMMFFALITLGGVEALTHFHLLPGGS